MNIVFDTTESVTIRFAGRAGNPLADTLTVSWDAVESRVVVSATRPDALGRSGAVYNADMTTLAIGDEELLEYRQRFDTLLRMSVIERVANEGDCPLSDHYSEAGIAELVTDVNTEFAKLMDGPMDGCAIADEAVTANGLYDRLMARIAARTGQRWPLQPEATMSPSSDTLARLVALIADHLGMPRDQIVVASTWSWDELGADSLDMMELVMAAEEEFGIEIEDEQVEATTNVTEFAAVIDRMLALPPKGVDEPSDEAVEAFRTAFHGPSRSKPGQRLRG
jgi:acyl carrier protein